MSMGKSFPFPVLSEYSMDYADGIKYSAELSYKKNAGVVIFHQITGESFVSELISKKAANFACLISRPSSMFRKTFVLEGQDGKLAATQSIAPSDFYASDILEGSFFLPMMLTNQDVNETIKAAHNFDKICWDEGEIFVPRGGIVALENWKRLKNDSASSIFVFKPSPQLSNGKISVEPNMEGGFKFVVNMDEKLFEAMRNPTTNKDHVGAILTHALSVGFEKLAKEYRHNWEEHPNLKLLADELAERNIPHWEEDGFKPEQAATSMHPHKPPKVLSEESLL